MSRLRFAKFNWQRILRVFPSSFRPTGVALLVLIVLVIYSLGIIGSIIRGAAIQHEAAKLQHQVALAQQRKNRYQQLRDALSTPEGVFAEARRNGMVKPNEVAVRIPPIPATPAVSTKPVKQPVDDSWGGVLLAGLILFMLAFFTGLGVLLFRWRATRARRPAGVLTPRSELRKRRRRAPEPLPEGKSPQSI